MFNVSQKSKTCMYCDWNKDLLIDFLLFGLSGKGFEMRENNSLIFFLASANFSSKIEKNLYSSTWKYTREKIKINLSEREPHIHGKQ